jgi:hypothetical protein
MWNVEASPHRGLLSTSHLESLATLFEYHLIDFFLCAFYLRSILLSSGRFWCLL